MEGKQYMGSQQFAFVFSMSLLGHHSYQFVPSSLQNTSSPARLNGKPVWCSIFKSSPQKNHTLIQVWAIQEHEHTLIYSSNSLGLLSFQLNLHLSLKCFTAFNRFSSRIFLYLALFMFSSTLKTFLFPHVMILMHHYILCNLWLSFIRVFLLAFYFHKDKFS